MIFYNHLGYRFAMPVARQIIRIMRLVIILMTIGFLQVSAAGYGQRITLSESNASLEKVINKIRTQAGYDFLGDTRLIRAARPVSINVKDAPIEKVLEICFAGQPLTYSVNDKIVVITEKELSILDNLTKSVRTLFQQDSVTYRGRVQDENGKPMPGVTVMVKSNGKVRSSNSEGVFVMYGPREATLVFSYVGYGAREVKVDASVALRPFTVTMVPVSKDLQNVNIVSTGYQDIPKERATGSFEVITAKQLEHSTSPSLLRRLEGITMSMDFRNDMRATNSSAARSKTPVMNTLTIRGKNNLELAFSGILSGSPLVVIDGIASAFDIEQINPNEVESVTILKDAAAASIWGARAANGVIVIKTKKGDFDSPTRVSFNTDITTADKIDLYYLKTMSVSDFVDAQKYSFDQKYPLLDFPMGTSPLGDINLIEAQDMFSPVFEILNSQRNRSITEAEANVQLDKLRNNDIRREYNKYFLKNQISQQYNLAVDGGTKRTAYRLSGGYNRVMENTKNAGSERMSLSYDLSAKVIKNLRLNLNLNYIQNNTRSQSTNNAISSSFIQAPFYPYTKLADDEGKALEVPRDYRPGFVDLLEKTYGSKILNMRWKPLENINKGDVKNKIHNIGIQTTADYQIDSIFSANLSYSYNKSIGNSKELVGADSYYMRELINRYTNPTTFNRAIPLGGQVKTYDANSDLHTFRGLINANKSWNNVHQINALAGVDVTDNSGVNQSNRYLGYNEKTLKVNASIDYKTAHPLLFTKSFGSPNSVIPPEVVFDFIDTKTRTYGIFSNMAYTYKQIYTVTGSIRKDASSEFGKGTNSKGAPFFSVGAGWTLSKEKFYGLSWLPELKLRATYGYNGNVNPRVTAIPTISPGVNATTGFPIARADNNATNSKLRPEKTGVLNIGLDFAIPNNRVSGTIEYYDKRTKDLIKYANVDPTLGYSQLTYNSGNLHGYGVDFNLNTINIQSSDFNWSSVFLFSYNRAKITKLFTAAKTLAYELAGTPGINFIEGYDINALFAWRWAGLDPQSGDPRILIDNKPLTVTGAESELSTATISDLNYVGSARPVYSGSFRNTFTYKNFYISFNLMYKLGHYSLRPSLSVVQYANLFGNTDILQGEEYGLRWRQPGDELKTNVPSQVYKPGFEGTNRDFVYAYSDVNVIKADHIRLQEINLSYALKNRKGFLKNARIYANVSNLGIIWKANKFGIDPDIFDYPAPRQYSFGISSNF